MPIDEKGEGEYKDSYQKREMLLNELRAAIDEIKNLILVARKDFGNVKDFSERYDAIEKKMDELAEQERLLDEELKKQQTELNNLNESATDTDEKIDSSMAMWSEISLTREKLLEIWEERDSLLKELEKIIEEETGQKGDYEGSMALVKARMKKIEELKRQLDELDANDEI